MKKKTSCEDLWRGIEERERMEKRWREREGGQLPAMVANMRGVYCKVERGKQ